MPMEPKRDVLLLRLWRDPLGVLTRVGATKAMSRPPSASALASQAGVASSASVMGPAFVNDMISTVELSLRAATPSTKEFRNPCDLPRPAGSYVCARESGSHQKESLT